MCGGPVAMDQALRAYRERCRGAYRGLGAQPDKDGEPRSAYR